jgi:putative transposase
VYPPDVIHNQKRKEDTPMNYNKFNQLWAEVKDYYVDWEQEAFAEPGRRMLKDMLENAMKAEVLGYVRRRRYERSKEMIDYRNGYYHRNLVTSMGLIPRLRVPRMRKQGVRTKVFRRYKRRWKEVDEWIRGVFIAGISTREVGWVLKELLQAQVSASAVSLITKQLDHQVRLFHRRLLKDEYVYLFLDGVVKRVVSCGKAVKKVILVAYGIRQDGQREVIDYRIAKSESEHDWTVFLNDIYQRGLHGEQLRLIITDGGRGLLAALDMLYPHVARQRCWVHKLRNMAACIPRRYQAACLKEAKRIYAASNYRMAIQQYKTWCQKWRRKVPKAVHCLEQDIEDMLLFFDHDKKLWIKLRTTNVIERFFKELRKRTRPMSLFANKESCNRILYALFAKYNKKWEDRRYAIF